MSPHNSQGGVVLAFPPQPRLLSHVSLLRLDGTPFASATFLPGAPAAAWNWIAGVVALEVGCSPEEVQVGEEDTVCVDGLPLYMVEIVRPVAFRC